MSGNWTLEEAAVYAVTASGNKRIIGPVDGSFRQGRITLLAGANGAGKSTLLETMAGLRALQSGSVALGESSLWEKGKRGKMRLNRSVLLDTGISLQHSEAQWFAPKVSEEFRFSLKPYKLPEVEQEERIRKAMKATGLPLQLADADPWTLSGGQQRRLSLACLLACQPKWLLLDEPTSGLDTAGVSQLLDVLRVHREAGGGAVISTHDLDALLPIADEVAVMEDGLLLQAVPAAEWAAAHASDGAAPQALRVLAELQRTGIEISRNSKADLWPSSSELARALASQFVRHPHEEVQEVIPRSVQPAAAVGMGHQASSDVFISEHRLQHTVTISGTSPYTGVSAAGLASRFDPRALILSYVLLAAAILMQGRWPGIAAAALLTGVVLFPLRAQIRPWIKVIRAYSIMIAAIAFIAGIQLKPFGFEWTNAQFTLLRFSGLLLVMLLGLPMLAMVTPLRVQRAIEQTFGWLSRFKVPVSSAALTVTLIFRFIPLLGSEWQRFATIAHARGKATTQLGSLPVAMLFPVIIPYIRSLLRLAEQLADALEARGIGNPNGKPTRGFVLQFTARDALLMLAALLSATLLIYVNTAV
ncbi:ATP-binding cassette domain-containing protein [Paenibacillus gorillae]|uniref:ATP-binding cassette domain-containing protein n=1 Tax=Paenibacillus gorillae TaxID=1243662 RepID=UPI0004B7CC6F|nr:ATP-binding cassette domain-containing protein [Paenibacillus gorillae]